MISEETRRKMSESQKGKKHPHHGHPTSEETKRKISNKKSGCILSDEHKKKISDSIRGEKNPNYGKHFTEDHRRKISESRKHLSEETRKKLSSNRGRIFSEETRRKMSEAHLGEKCYLWKGGVSFEPYCQKFNNKFRERVRAFFGYICQECGTPQNGERLHIHHINFNKQSCCDGTQPLFIALCRACHVKTNHNREYWVTHFTEIINNYYQGRCYLSNDEMTQLSCEIGGT